MKRLSGFVSRFVNVLCEFVEIFTVRSFPLPRQLTYGPVVAEFGLLVCLMELDSRFF
jgi:hypothetical protein